MYVGQSAMLIRKDGSEQPVVVTDTSKGGLGFAGANSLAIGERIILRSRVDGDLAIEVRWASAQRAGGSFPIDTCNG